MRTPLKKFIFFTLSAFFIISAAAANAEEKSLRDYFQEANAFRNKGKYDTAEASYSKAIELNSSYEVLYYERGEIRFKKNDQDGAIQDLTKALNLSPRNKKAYHAYCLRGTAWYQKRDLAKAEADFDKAMTIDPVSDEAYIGRGDVYGARGLHEKAVLAYSRAIELQPSRDKAYSSRAKTYFTLGKYKNAHEDYDRAIGLNPSGDAAYEGRGRTRFVQSDYRGALSDFRRAVELNPAQEQPLEDFIDQAQKILKT